MYDKYGNIIPPNISIKVCYQFIKDNTAQIVLMLSVLSVIYVAVSNYYFYIINCGYYKYFKIDGNLMLPYDMCNIYQSVSQLALASIYWGFTILAVRVFMLKRNWIEISLFWLLIPILINCAMGYSGIISVPLIVAGVAVLPFQWIMMYAMGYCLARPFHGEIVSKSTGKTPRRKRGRQWGNKEYKLLGILLILAVCIMIFAWGYYSNRNEASVKKRFGIVEVAGEQYAVIAANESKIILQKCEVQDNILKIDCDTYLCTGNEHCIAFKTFDFVNID